ncbi:MAG: hypothetical protein K2K81_07045 [Muribaculaceae bacterium]|nr:hypothetical protein [Muribaculaceae bacterium]
MKKFYAFAAAGMMAFAANAQDLYVCGNGDGLGWDPAAPLVVEKTGDNYTFEVTNLSGLKISTAMGDWDAFNGGVYGCAYGEEQGVAVALEAGYTSNIETPWKGDYTVTVAGDLSTIKLSTETPKPSEDALPEVYLRGDMVEGWAAVPEWKMEAKSKTLFTFTCAEDQVIGAGVAFKFADADWGKINVGGDGNPFILDTDIEVFNGGDPANITLEEEWNGVVWLTLDLDGAAYVVMSNDKSFVPEWAEGGQGAVSAIATDNNVAPKYFNLQGVQVANPENGLFIVVKGNKTSKVLVK